MQAKPPGAVPGASHPQRHLCRGPSFHQGRIDLTSPPIAVLRMPCRDGHTRGKTWEKCIVWLLLCHTMECEPSHYVVWQKANHRNRHFPMIRENALIPALPHQPKNRRKSCGVVHGQPEPDSWNQAAPGPITMAWWWSLCWRSFCPYRLWSRSASWTADSTSAGRPLACAAPASGRRSAWRCRPIRARSARWQFRCFAASGAAR